MEYASLIICFIAGCFVGYRVSDRLHQSVMPDMFRRLGVTPEQLEQVMQDLKKEINQEEGSEEDQFPRIEIRIEQHGEQLYAFRKDTDEFLGQGASKEALIERMGEKLRNVRLVISKEDGAGLIGSESFNYDTGTKELKQGSS